MLLLEEKTVEENHLDAIKKLAGEVGPEAQIHTSIDYNQWRDRKELPVKLALYPRGILGIAGPVVYGRTIVGLVDRLREAWENAKAQRREALVLDMAAAIIRLKAEHGVCTESGLRMRNFSTAEIDDLGTEACAKAEEMANLGPFNIERLQSANAAA